MKRTIKIKNERLYKILEKKDVVLAKARATKGEADKLQEKLQKYGLEINKFKEKLFPLVKKIKEGMKDDLNEFEEFETVEAIEGEIEIVIFDMVEEYKDVIRAKKREQLKKDEEK